jgi:D-xylose transport system ATP-binding protein
MFDLVKQGVSIIMVSSELSEVLGVSDRVLVIGEGKLRGDFINHNLTQETILAAALDQSLDHSHDTVHHSRKSA